MLKWILAGLMLSFASLAAYLYFHLGLYKEAQIEGIQKGGFWLLYQEHTGPYHQISPVLDSIEKQALGASITCLDTFGLFLDDPATVDEDRLRSELGCILTGEIQHVPEGLKVKAWNPGPLLHLTFTGSPAVSPFKVYPKAEQWFQEQRKPMPKEALEIYSQSPRGDLITHYYFPIL